MRTITAERSDRGPSTIRPDIRPRVRSRSAAGLERGEARVDLQLVLVGIERGELLVQRRRRDLLHAPDLRLLAPDLLLEAGQLARRVEDRGALEGLLHLALCLRHLRPAHQLVALLDQLLAASAELVQAILELAGELRLLRPLRLERLGLALEAELPAERDPGELVEPIRLRRVPRGAQLVGAPGRGGCLAAPFRDRVASLAGIVLDEPQVPDRLGR